MREELRNWSRFVQAEAHIFREFPGLIFQTAANAFEFQSISQAALQRFELGREKRLWFRAVNRLPRQSHRRLTLSNHTAPITACSFSRDGDRILSASKDGTIQISSESTGVRLLQILAPLIPDEQAAPEGLDDLAMFEEETDEHNWQWFGSRVGWNVDKVRQSWEQASFSPDGTRVLANTEKEFHVIDASFGSKLNVILFANRPFHSIRAFSPEGNQLLVEIHDRDSRTSALKLFDTLTGEEVSIAVGLTGHTEAVFSPDGTLVLVSNDGTKVFNPVTGEQILKLSDVSGGDRPCAFTPNGSQLLCRHEKTLALWNLLERRLLLTLDDDYSKLSAVCFSPDSSMILCGSSDGVLTLVELASRARSREWSGHTGRVVALGFSTDGNEILSGAADGTVKVWDRRQSRVSDSVSRSKITGCAFSSEGTQIVTTSLDRTINVWDGHTCASQLAITLEQSAHDCAFAPDSDRFACVIGREVHIFNATTGEKVRVLGPSMRALNACAFSPDGTQVMAASTYGGLLLWDSSTGQQLQRLSSGGGNDTMACAFSQTGNYALSGDLSGLVRFWSLSKHPLSVALHGHTQMITSVRFSPSDEKVWISTSTDGTIRQWTGRNAGRVFCGHTSSVNDCAFSPDGALLLSASTDGWIKLWRLENAEEVGQYQCDDAITHVDWSSDGSRIVLSTVSGDVQLLRLEGFTR